MLASQDFHSPIDPASMLLPVPALPTARRSPSPEPVRRHLSAHRWLVRCLAVTIITAIAGPVTAQDYVTSAWVYLRHSPSNTGARLRTLRAGDSLLSRSVDPRPGWLPVRTMDGKAGWVGETYVRSLTAMAASANTSLITSAGGAPFTAIDPAWAKPPIAESVIQVQGGALACGPTGDVAADDGTNRHKNRADIPSSSHLISLEAIRALPDTALWRFTNRKHWTADDSALVVPYEGIPVTVEGYFEIVKPQQASAPTGGNRVGEATNCHSWAEGDTDWHMAVVANPSETEDRAVVVEPTPRTKRNNAGWTPLAAAALAVRRSATSPRDESHAVRVRVTGFLLLDPVHPAHIAGKCTSNCAGKSFYRATLWEIHPVTRIEVLRNGQWTDLNDEGPP